MCSVFWVVYIHTKYELTKRLTIQCGQLLLLLVLMLMLLLLLLVLLLRKQTYQAFTRGEKTRERERCQRQSVNVIELIGACFVTRHGQRVTRKRKIQDNLRLHSDN